MCQSRISMLIEATHTDLLHVPNKAHEHLHPPYSLEFTTRLE